ncbi:preprotein translocase subunit SecE [bacterium]|nr:preprotein translocase subunit SecE [bacterium]
MFAKIMQFLRECRIELMKVSWPTRKETINSTVIIVIVVFVFAFFLGLSDIILSKGIEPFFSGGGKTWSIIAAAFLGLMIWAIYDTTKS